MSAPEGFLTRWSKRKLATEAPAGGEPEIEEAKVSESHASDAEAPEAGAMPQETALAHLAPEPEPEFDVSTLPPIESLTGTSDLSVFMQKGVPEALKNSALRHAWALDPIIRDYRGPVDYAWDFNDPLAMPGFSPLAPEFDTAEMLRRIMGDPAEVRDVPPAEAISGGADFLPAAEEAGCASHGSGEAVFGPEATVLAAAKAPGKTVDQESGPHETAEENALLPVGRRHGGALPL